MRYRRLGDSGLVVSVVGLGCNNFGFGERLDLEATRAVVHAALDEGITLLDTADIYGESEAFLGEVLQGRRDDVVIATKFGHQGYALHGPQHESRGGRRYIRRAIEGSLHKLKTDRIDLYQMHTPDPTTPIEETLAALEELVREGKVRYIGTSNADSWQLADADWTARTNHVSRFVSVQNHYNLLERDAERDVIPACERFGIGFLPFFPLANGLLTGKYRRGEPPPEGTRLVKKQEILNDHNFDVVERLEKYAAQRGLTLLDIAIGGLAAQPAVASVIAGATKPEQVRANVAAGNWVPTPEDLEALDEAAPSPRSR
jgi:aryl-alcohol dehydrogenase-like predicted oxidoreductase